MSRPSTFTGSVDLDQMRTYADRLATDEHWSASSRLYACTDEIERLRAEVTRLQEREDYRDPPRDRD